VHLLSHSNKSVTIYTKSAYLEEGLYKFVNMSEVVMTSHPDLLDFNRKTMIIPTNIGQVSKYEKSLFHLLSVNSDEDLKNEVLTKSDEVLSVGDFTEFEQNLFVFENI